MGSSSSTPQQHHSSKRQHAPDSDALPTARGGSGSTTMTAASLFFDVIPARELATMGIPNMRLRLDEESLAVLDPSGAIVVAWPYHRVLCWGYTSHSFQWRVCTSMGEADQRAAAEAADAVAADFATSSPTDTPAAALVTGASVVFQVKTNQGKDIEAAFMLAVQRLMAHMTARGVGASEFRDVVAALAALAEEGLTDHALSALRQLTLGRVFDSRQAALLLNALGAVSPFDRVEAACALYPSALLHPSAFPSLLHEAFDDEVDIENVLHRLGLKVASDGTVANAPNAASRAARAREGKL